MKLLKFHYVLAYATLGAIMPYLPLYAQQQGLSGTEVGWVMGVFGLAVLVAPPVHTLLADRYMGSRTLITGCYLLGGAASVWLVMTGRFIELAIGHLVFSVGLTALIPLMDGLTFAELGRRGAAARSPSYQSVRLWGSIGWMLPGFGFAMMSLPALAEFTEPMRITRIALWLAVGLCTTGLIASRWLANRRPQSSTAPGSPEPVNGEPARAIADTAAQRQSPDPKADPLPTLQALRVLIRQPMLSFAISTFALFMGISVYYAFYPQYVEKTGVPARYIGLITNIGVLVEILIVLVSVPLLNRVGIKGVMLLGAGCSMVRLGLLAVSDSMWIAIGSQVFHGPMVLALHFVPPVYFNRQAGPAFRNSMQGLYVMLCFGVARLIGSAIGGYCVDLGGTRTIAGLQLAFAGGAVMCLIATLWMGLGFKEERSHTDQGRS